jgi:alkanesulfonate monooxygenase SsuD/methylene tetrahydromethanopterin reductase-like flavin-dependent oxidoreductase (luciferase family)
MKTSFFCQTPYESSEVLTDPRGWPSPPSMYDTELGTQTFEHMLVQAKTAEDLGFDWISASEHHYLPLCPTPVGAMVLARLSATIKRAKLAYMGPLVSINNPIRVAEEIAMLDQLSGGRAVVLFLRGTPNEFLAYGVMPEETRARTQEAIALIVRALTEPEPFSWEGRHFRFRTVSVWPGVTQRPLPPIISSGNSLESATFAARNRQAMGMSFYPSELVARLTSYFRDECAKEGWTPTSDDLVYRCFVGIGETQEEVRELEQRYFGKGEKPTAVAIGRGRSALVAGELKLPQPPTEIGTDADAKNVTADKGVEGFGLGRLQFCGTPDEVVEQITAFHEATGVGVIDCGFNGGGLSHEQVIRSLNLFGSEVLPRIRHLGASPDRLKETTNVVG